MINKFSSFFVCLLAIISLALSANSRAVEATDFLKMKVPNSCSKEFVNYTYFLDWRDKGIGQAASMKFAVEHGYNSDIFSDGVNNAYKYPELNKNALGMYFLWSCMAANIELNVLPISQVKDELQECATKVDGKTCFIKVRNKIIGLPIDYIQPLISPPQPIGLPKLRYAMPKIPCDKPVWPQEALRRELKGTVIMKFLIDVDGRVLEKEIMKSSGHEILDLAALDATARCTFIVSPQSGQLDKEWVMLQYVWTLD